MLRKSYILTYPLQWATRDCWWGEGGCSMLHLQHCSKIKHYTLKLARLSNLILVLNLVAGISRGTNLPSNLIFVLIPPQLTSAFLWYWEAFFGSETIFIRFFARFQVRKGHSRLRSSKKLEQYLRLLGQYLRLLLKPTIECHVFYDSSYKTKD